MSPPMLRPEAVVPARAAYVAAVKAGAGPSDVVAAVVGAYLQAANDLGPMLEPIRRQRQVSACTRTMAALKPGESAIIGGIVAGQLVRHYDTARRILNNPHAVWTSATQPDRTVLVTRNEDGVNLRDPKRNAKAVELAAMAIGESRISETITTHATGSVHLAKAQARRILADPKAQWSLAATSKGMRVTRVDPTGVAEEALDRRVPKGVLQVMRAVARLRGVLLSEMVGPSRVPRIAQARWDAVERLHQLTDRRGSRLYSPREIGRFVGRDRTSVLHILRMRKVDIYPTGSPDAA